MSRYITELEAEEQRDVIRSYRTAVINLLAENERLRAAIEKALDFTPPRRDLLRTALDLPEPPEDGSDEDTPENEPVFATRPPRDDEKG